VDLNADYASLGFAVAFVLALGFHRHRAAQAAALLSLLALAVDAGSLALREAGLRLLPWLVLICALMPEARLLSRRHASLVLTVGILLLVALQAPPALLAMPVRAAAWPLFGLDPGNGAGLLLALAALACGVRFLRQTTPVEAGLAFNLLLAAAGCWHPAALPHWLLASAFGMIGSVLYASYRMAFVDTLSGLPNRRALDEALGRLSGHFNIAMVDIDHFKAFNDTHGHDAGDMVLQRVATALRHAARGSVYRYGGEEFCVLYHALPIETCIDHLERARATVSALAIVLPTKPGKRARASAPGKMRRAKQKPVAVTVSMGIAERSAQRSEPKAVLKAADQALYQAKAKGRNRVERAR